MLRDALSAITSIVGQLASVIVMLSDPPEGEFSINYKLHTPDFVSEITLLNETEYTFNSDKELKIFCHDWENLDNIDWYDYMIEEYKKHGDYTIITANYASVFKDVTGDSAFMYAKPLGEALGDYILELRRLGVRFEKIHVIGHRIGAHIAGVAGERVYEVTGENIDRITGLDPSEPGFFELVIDGRLSRDDAKFVDVIHASYNVLWVEMGRVDFYPNSLAWQCDYAALSNITDIAPKLYSMTIAPKNGKKFKLEKCGYLDEECKNPVGGYMGEYTNRKTYGSFYFLEKSGVSLCKILDIPLTPDEV